jgi:hypothetical protein
MPKTRYQTARVEEVGKRIRQWRGHYFVYAKLGDGSEIRKHKMMMLGLKSRMTQFQAEQKLREIVMRAFGESVGLPDGSVSLEWFWANRFLPLQTWCASMRSVVGYVMISYLLPEFGTIRLCDIQKFHLQAHLDELAEKYSKSLVGKVRTWIKAVLDEAVAQKYLRKSQARAVLLSDRASRARGLHT